jgi:hypothetical protein
MLDASNLIGKNYKEVMFFSAPCSTGDPQMSYYLHPTTDPTPQSADTVIYLKLFLYNYNGLIHCIRFYDYRGQEELAS